LRLAMIAAIGAFLNYFIERDLNKYRRRREKWE
jgi:hypothetical protein